MTVYQTDIPASGGGSNWSSRATVTSSSTTTAGVSCSAGRTSQPTASGFSTSPVVDERLDDANIRGGTGVSIIAVQRGTETVSNPEPSFELQVGDVLVAIGTRTEQSAFRSMVGE